MTTQSPVVGRNQSSPKIRARDTNTESVLDEYDRDPKKQQHHHHHQPVFKMTVITMMIILRLIMLMLVVPTYKAGRAHVLGLLEAYLRSWATLRRAARAGDDPSAGTEDSAIAAGQRGGTRSKNDE